LAPGGREIIDNTFWRKLMRILVDMDGVLADFEGGFLKLWKQAYPHKPYIPVENRNVFYITDQYPQEWRADIHQIFTQPNFFRNLEPIPGGREALSVMKALGLEVFICTSPLEEYRHCVLEKYEWVNEYLGPEWIEKIILTRDKTLVNADILIDDRPELPGVDTPTWEHILFEAAYNDNLPEKRRLNWQSWRSVLLNEG
jgi:5'-nucleotidase